MLVLSRLRDETIVIGDNIRITVVDIRGDKVRVKLRANKHFRLPDPSRDVIMVGPGTGVAPFRAFVQDRRATAAKGRNWLFFGDRNFTHDFLKR